MCMCVLFQAKVSSVIQTPSCNAEQPELNDEQIDTVLRAVKTKCAALHGLESVGLGISEEGLSMPR